MIKFSLSQPICVVRIQVIPSLLQSGAAYRSRGFECEDLGSSPLLVGRYCSYLLPKQARGTSQILIFKTSRRIGRPTL